MCWSITVSQQGTTADLTESFQEAVVVWSLTSSVEEKLPGWDCCGLVGTQRQVYWSKSLLDLAFTSEELPLLDDPLTSFNTSGGCLP